MSAPLVVVGGGVRRALPFEFATREAFLRFVTVGRGHFMLRSLRTGVVFRFSCVPWAAQVGPSIKLVSIPASEGGWGGDAHLTGIEKDAVGFVETARPWMFRGFRHHPAHDPAHQAITWLWPWLGSVSIEGGSRRAFRAGARPWPLQNCAVLSDGRCAKCRRALSDDVSKALGLGPDCHEHVVGVEAARLERRAAAIALETSDETDADYADDDGFDAMMRDPDEGDR